MEIWHHATRAILLWRTRRFLTGCGHARRRHNIHLIPSCTIAFKRCGSGMVFNHQTHDESVDSHWLGIPCRFDINRQCPAARASPRMVRLVDYLPFVDDTAAGTGMAHRLPTSSARQAHAIATADPRTSSRKRLLKYPAAKHETRRCLPLAAEAKEAIYARMWKVLLGRIGSGRPSRPTGAHEISETPANDLPDYFRRPSSRAAPRALTSSIPAQRSLFSSRDIFRQPRQAIKTTQMGWLVAGIVYSIGMQASAALRDDLTALPLVSRRRVPCLTAAVVKSKTAHLTGCQWPFWSTIALGLAMSASA